eukprot:TRINITY_DN13010_c0_g1_i1.p1 TRINITY_DN13010_c0_g1~~TRINITY_DN13010_c0_g1_i1.p1  ORF type:complete len:1235 (-),score=234.51 TRINITY_DN13010_c0_g1_i1:22-3726(-)
MRTPEEDGDISDSLEMDVEGDGDSFESNDDTALLLNQHPTDKQELSPITDPSSREPQDITKSPVKINREFFIKLYKIMTYSGTSLLSIPHLLVWLLLFLSIYLASGLVAAAEWNGYIMSILTNGGTVWDELLPGVALYTANGFAKAVALFVSDMLAWYWRRSITAKVTKKYLRGVVPYHINLMEDAKVDNPDQRIVADIKSLCDNLSFVVALGFQAILQIGLFSVSIYASIGWYSIVVLQAPSLLFFIAYYFLLKKLAKVTFFQDQMEGNFRYSHARIREYAESIAFYGGEEMEKKNCDLALKKAVKNKYVIAKWFTVFKLLNSFNRWGIDLISFFACGLILWRENYTAAELSSKTTVLQTEAFIAMGAVEQLVSLGTNIGIIAGSVGRVSQLLEKCEYVEKHKKVNKKNLVDNEDAIVFSKVSYQTPNSTDLVEKLSFQIQRYENLLIMGPSGCGKSSLLRCLTGLWEFSGTIERPSNGDDNNIMYFPQKAYTTFGSLMEQMIYPHKVSTKSDEDLVQILEMVKLRHICEDRGLHEVCRWNELLSPGEQQRLMFARLFYHVPRFAVLDEPTSALDQQNEEAMLTHCQNLGITVVSVGHRPTLMKYHKKLLLFDGKGNFTFTTIDQTQKDPELSDSWITIENHPGDDDQIEPPVVDIAPAGTESSSFSFKKYFSAVQKLWSVGHGACCCSCSKATILMIFFMMTSISSSITAAGTSLVFRQMADGITNRDEALFYKYTVISTIVVAVLVGSLTALGAIAYYLGIIYRKNITKNIHNQYFHKNVILHLNTIHKEIDNPDQRIQTSVDYFTSGFETSGLMSIALVGVVVLPLPFLGLAVLTSYAGWLVIPLEAAVLILYSFLTFPLLPTMTKREYEYNLKEGDLRYAYIQIQENAEAIAFYGTKGIQRERQTIDHLMNTLIQYQFEWIKVKTVLASLLQISFSNLLPISTVIVLTSLEFTGKFATIPDKNKFGLISQSVSMSNTTIATASLILNTIARASLNNGHLLRITELIDTMNGIPTTSENIHIGEKLKLKNLVCSVPNGKTLNKHGFSMTLKQNQTVLIMGPSGCGKSTLLRTISGLWPIQEGSLVIPQSIFFLPQKPYMVLGNLRSQIIYPDTHEDSASDNTIRRAMEKAHILYLLDRFTLDDVQIWETVLSPGEQQRVSLARLFYHQPKFAMMDESTSALDQVTEKNIFENIKADNISILAVGHSPNLTSYFNYLLKMDGKGGWQFLHK